MATVAPHEEALAHWREALVSWVKGGNPDLTNRQMALLLCVSLDPSQQTASGLAARLGVTKPVVSRTLDKLCRLKYVRRVSGKRDRRYVFVTATDTGREFLDDFARGIQ